MIIWQQTLLEFGENLIFMFFFSLSAAELISFHSNLIILIISNYVLLPKKNGNFEMPYFNLGSNFYTKKLFYDFSKL